MTSAKYPLGHSYLDTRAKTLWSWRQTGHLCDVTLKVGATSLTAHRVVLAPVSQYFESKFSGHFDANDKVMTFVDLSKDVERVAELELVLEAIYTGELTLDEECINGVLYLASFLMIDCILEACQVYLEEHLTLATCLDFYLMAETYNLTSIFQVTTNILQCRLHDYFIHGDKILQVNDEGLRSIFRNNLHLHCLPGQVVDLFVRWTEASGANRSLELFSEVIQAESDARLHEMLANLSARSDKSSSLRESFEDVIRKEVNSRQEAPDSHDTQAEPGPSEHCDHQQSSSIQAEPSTSLQATAVNRKSCTKECSLGHPESNLNFMDKTSAEEENEGKTAAVNTEKLCLGSTDENSVQNPMDFQLPSTSGSTALRQAFKRTLEPSCSSSSNAAEAGSSVESASGEPSVKRRCVSACGAEDKEEALEVLIVLAPAREVVQSNYKPRRGCRPMELVVYSPSHRKWSRVGSVTCPMILDEKSSWRITSVGEDLIFITPFDVVGHRLSLRSLEWTELYMDSVFEGLQEVYTVVPLNVRGQLYVLASNRLCAPEERFLTEHKYFRLEADESWTEVGEVSHLHSQQPLSIITVSGSRVFTLKADIPPLVFRDHLILQEGHILDTATGDIQKFAEMCLVHSPSRMLVQDGEVYLVEGDRMMLKFDQARQKWTTPEPVDLRDLRWCRKHAAESHFPCQGHASTTAGHSFFEVHGFADHTSSLLQVAMGKTGKLETITHVPPPCNYFTLISAGKVDPQFFNSLQQCSFFHA